MAGAGTYENLMKGSYIGTCLHCLVTTFDRFPIASGNFLIERTVQYGQKIWPRRS
jgi:hypothetical protein